MLTYLRTLATAILLLLLAVALCSCRTSVRYLPVESVRTEYVRTDTTGLYDRIRTLLESRREKQTRIDSVIDRMKETVVLNENGDTTKHTQYQYVHLSTREKKELESKIAEKDSTIAALITRLESVKTDTVSVPVPVERELTRWQQTKMEIGGIAIGGSLVLLALLAVAVAWLVKSRKK